MAVCTLSAHGCGRQDQLRICEMKCTVNAFRHISACILYILNALTHKLSWNFIWSNYSTHVTCSIPPVRHIHTWTNGSGIIHSLLTAHKRCSWAARGGRSAARLLIFSCQTRRQFSSLLPARSTRLLVFVAALCLHHCHRYNFLSECLPFTWCVVTCLTQKLSFSCLCLSWRPSPHSLYLRVREHDM